MHTTIRPGTLNGPGIASLIGQTLDEMSRLQGPPPSDRKVPTARREQSLTTEPVVRPVPSSAPRVQDRLTLTTFTLDAMLTAHERLKSCKWSDAEIRRIPDESFARLAHEESEPLQQEFGSADVFVAYWQGQRRKLGLSVSACTKASGNEALTAIQPEDAGPLHQKLTQEWVASAALRAEFSDRFSTYCAFKRAESRGLIRAAVGRVTGPQSNGA